LSEPSRVACHIVEEEEEEEEAAAKKRRERERSRTGFGRRTGWMDYQQVVISQRLIMYIMLIAD
jgi:hypothetical protein